jgi:arginase
MRNLAVLDAPSNLGLRPLRPGHVPGVWRLPGALRAQGLVERLQALDAGEVAPVAYSPAPDPRTGFRNGTQIAAYSTALAQRVATLILAARFPVVLGGDCSILLGNTLALRNLGRYGLCFLDGHADFAYPRTAAFLGSYAAAGLDLALATGHGPEALTDLQGLRPYVDEADVVLLGFSDDPADGADFETEALYLSRIQTIGIEALRALGPGRATAAALERLERPGLDGFWIHLDADVLDQSVLPAVDSPNPRGLGFEDLTAILQGLLRSDRAAGIEITILDPELDPDGHCAGELVEAIVRSFD